MLLNTILSLILAAALPQADVFKRERTALQQEVEAAVSPVVFRILQPPKATYLEGYGIVVTLEVALAQSRTPFSSPAAPGEIQSSVNRRRQDLQEKMEAFVKGKAPALSSLAPNESLAVVTHILNTNPADVTNLPNQIVMTVKKQTPQQVLRTEF